MKLSFSINNWHGYTWQDFCKAAKRAVNLFFVVFVSHSFPSPYLLSITLSIKPYSSACCAVIKLSRSVSFLMTSRGLPVFSDKI